jgi:hypothetical protein
MGLGSRAISPKLMLEQSDTTYSCTCEEVGFLVAYFKYSRRCKFNWECIGCLPGRTGLNISFCYQSALAIFSCLKVYASNQRMELGGH